MGVGKTTVSQQLKKTLRNSVFLDGDWCWDADPFQVTEETKKMVMQNICSSSSFISSPFGSVKYFSQNGLQGLA